MTEEQRVVRQHLVPCEGLNEIRIITAKLEGRIDHVEKWEEQQNGTLKSVASKMDQMAETNNSVRIERFNQIADVTKKMNDNHETLVALVNSNYKLMTDQVSAQQRSFATILISAVAVTSAIIATVTGVVIKLMGGP